MSQNQKTAIRIVVYIISVVFAAGAAYSTRENRLNTHEARIARTEAKTECQEKRIVSLELHMKEQTTNQRWLMESNRRIEERLSRRD